jgi:hypothetical protein
MDKGNSGLLEPLRALVLSDLRRAQRLMLRVQDEIEPQMRVATPEGDYFLALTLSADSGERLHQMELFKWFMAWKMALGYIIAGQLEEPDCLYALGVTRRSRAGAISMIRRGPVPGFGPNEWLSRQQLAASDMTGFLPRGTLTITAPMLEKLESVFGAYGTFPAVRIADGVMGLGK